MTKLLPCPWCGKTPTALDLSEGSTFRWMYVTANCCGDVMTERRRSPYPAELGTGDDMERAIEWWNTRSTS